MITSLIYLVIYLLLQFIGIVGDGPGVQTAEMMVEQARSWIKENSTVVFFLLAQAAALAAGGATLLSYMVRLETRVYTMEHRGAEYTVARMEEMKQRITILEQQIAKNAAQIERVVTLLTRDVGK